MDSILAVGAAAEEAVATICVDSVEEDADEATVHVEAGLSVAVVLAAAATEGEVSLGDPVAVSLDFGNSNIHIICIDLLLNRCKLVSSKC